MIKENVKRILSRIPPGVEVVAATKSRTVDEINQAIEAGIEAVGENYVQEAEAKFRLMKANFQRHFIGHLQRNKVKKAVEIFDIIQTVDSFQIAQEINKTASSRGKIMSVLIEINSAGEKQKFGVLIEETERLIEKICNLKSVKIQGLMTMGPFLDNPQELRPYFSKVRKLFEGIKSLDFPDLDLRYLSMGMSDSYQVAIEEGANLVRIGTAIFK